MTRIPTLLIPLIAILSAVTLHASQVQLIIRGDDMGSTQASNVASIDAFESGIMRTVEVMSVCPWFEQAADMLQTYPELDVGVHLALTSEWSTYRWKPFTECPSLVDESGYFFPMVWKNDRYLPGNSIQESDWKLEEMEQEVRAQIEAALRRIPQVSHVTTHMGFAHLDPSIELMIKRVVKDYDIAYSTGGVKTQRFRGWENEGTLEDKIDQFCKNLKSLKPGRHLFVEHPAYDTAEMRSISHSGNSDVAEQRDHVTRVWRSDRVKQLIRELDIELVSYRELIERK